MKINFKLDKKINAEGKSPLFLHISFKKERKRKLLLHIEKKYFDEVGESIRLSYPLYDVYGVWLLELKMKAKTLEYKPGLSIDDVLDILFAKKNDDVLFYDFCSSFLKEKRKLLDFYERSNEIVNRNKMAGNLKVYENVLKQFEPFGKKVLVEELTTGLLLGFKDYLFLRGNKKNTIHLYLRTLRFLYNQACLKFGYENKKPFTGVFSGVAVKSYDTNKKYLAKETVLFMESIRIEGALQRAVDFWLLLFYFGGCDLQDLYFLKNDNIRDGRLIFERGKTNTGVLINLKIHPKAAVILKKYKSTGIYLFRFRKDVKGYETFRGNFVRDLKKVQELYSINLLPMGGSLGVKSARHTFATLAKNMFIEPDIIREIQGHLRDDVDNYYKARYSLAVIDEALFRVIG